MKVCKLVLAAATVSLVACAFGEILVKDGDTLAFLGDSITEFGQKNPDGYVNLTLRARRADGVGCCGEPLRGPTIGGFGEFSFEPEASGRILV